jgi:hypothetical protein
MTAARLAAFALCASLAATATRAQPPDTVAIQKVQREAMASIAAMDGTWRGPAWTLQPNGEKRHLTQTERIGPFLQGTVKVIEGRGYEADGRVTFNSLGIVSYDPLKKAFSLRAYALGHAGEFPFAATPEGYQWEVPAGPGAVIKYVATIKDGVLHEVGDRVVAGQPPMRVFEMKLQRLGDSTWPAGDAVPRQ